MQHLVNTLINSFVNKNKSITQNYITTFLITLLCIFFSSINTIYASDDKENLTVPAITNYLHIDDAFTPAFSQKGTQIYITFKIAPKYYMYQDIMSLTAENADITNIIIPKGTAHNDAYMGNTYIYTDSVTLEATVKNTNYFPKIKVTYQGCTTGLCYPPTTKIFNLTRINNLSHKPSGTIIEHNTDSKQEVASPQPQVSASNQLTSNVSNDSYTLLKRNNLFIALCSFFGFGVLLSLTPCMFPMYPIWSAIILGKKEKTIKSTLLFSFLYSQGLALAYMLIGFVIASAGARFHATMHQPWVLIAFSFLFIILALSCFGAFSLTLPISLQNKLNNESAKLKGGSYLGVLLMGALSAILASPCTTAPLAGAILFIAQEGKILIGGISLYIMALGMCIPLFIIALAGHKFLPKSGTWMTTVKVSCGFLMLIVPLILLENIIPTTILSYSWILLISSLAIYLIVKIIPRTPSKYYLSFKIIKIALLGLTTISAIIISISLWDAKVLTTLTLEEIKNLDELKAVITNNDTNNNVIIDFKASWCRECLHMDKTTFSDAKIKEALKHNVIYIVDVTNPNSDAQDVLKYYGLKGVPAIVILKKGENPIILNGYQSADDLLKYIQ